MKKLSHIILASCLLSTLGLSASESYTMNFDKDTRGLVRKLAIYKDPAWACKIITKENKEFFFISPKSLMEFYYKPYKWPSANIETNEGIKEIVVTDYKTLKPIDAKYAFFIYGSRKISFAGDDLVAFENINDAKEFMKNNNGRRILKFSELSEGLIQLLNGDI